VTTDADEEVKAYTSPAAVGVAFGDYFSKNKLPITTSMQLLSDRGEIHAHIREESLLIPNGIALVCCWSNRSNFPLFRLYN